MKFGFTMNNGVIIDIKNISTDISINNSVDYNNNKLKNSNYLFFNDVVTKEINFSSIVPNYDKELLNTYNNAWENNINNINEVIIYYNLFNDNDTGDNYLESSPNYYWVGFELEDSLDNSIIIKWSFIEYKSFKPVTKNFKIWSKIQTKNTNKTSSKKKGKNEPSNNTKLLLSKCGNLHRIDDKSVKCVKYLQKFLKSGGYYKGYKTDGIFSYYTERELKKAQKKRGLLQTGKWDYLTRCYYIIKYKYPSSTYKKIINGKSSKEMNKAYKTYKKIMKKKSNKKK